MVDIYLGGVDTVNELAALAGSNGLTASIKNGGRAGLFRFDSSPLIAEVAADPQQGIYIAPTREDGSTGAWVRQYGQDIDSAPDIHVGWFGAKGGGAIDNIDAFRAAHDSFGTTSLGGKIIIPKGVFYLSETWVITKRVTIVGANPGFQTNTAPTALKFPANTTGVRIHSSHTSDSPDGNSGAETELKDLMIFCSSKDATGHGLHASATFSLNNVAIREFAENGVHMVASASAETGNANLWSINNVYIYDNSGHGFYCSGNDVNAGVAINMNCTGNGGWGIYDSSFLGNTYVACHVASNTAGPVKTDTHAQNTFLGCYAEIGGKAELVSPTMVIGGILAAETNISESSTAFVFGGGGAYRKEFKHLNDLGSERVGANLGDYRANLAALTFGSESESATLDAWKLKFDPTDNSWYFQYANSPSFEPLALLNSASAPFVNNGFTGPVFQNGYAIRTSGSATNAKIRRIGTAAPTTGTYAQGDIFYNTAPTAGGKIGWVCVSGGTPGTWKPFGAIDA